ncbi:MAG: hypothetical protein B6A08_10480 [Sorangiineae bacterium NIC37A_2]|jgi:hypothetical protein|nr:MAG: hypothetical protein B6A08_10480 [Sorangiineae bacterium NIC37A_2]
MLERRTFLAQVAALGLPLLWPEEADASALTGLTLAELVGRSDRVAVCEPVASECMWAEVAGTKRIVTLTRLLEVEKLTGGSSPSEHITMTLGGRVGDLGQKVHGEAVLPPGVPVVVFLGRDQAGHGIGFHRRVIGMAQGSYEVDGTDRARPLRPNRNLPHLIRRPGVGPLAVDELAGKSLSESARLIRGAAR